MRHIRVRVPDDRFRGTGLNPRYCRRHEDHFERHGSYVKGSYSAGQLAPHRRSAIWLLKARQGTARICAAVGAVQSIYAGAGASVDAFQLRGLPPADRARAIWATLRERRVDPLRVLAEVLALQTAIRNDPQPDHRTEFRIVQLGKLVHRLAGGSHRKWERTTRAGMPNVIELHRYRPSRGRVLRHLGATLEHAEELLEAELLSEA